ncbi:hypothetical protein WMY93_019015 [Mugilogobius chulae]|uniref:Uncharacterized protein n=1 Tax=Mugilogobius chulae TaxID=88201 RepID=A0AAW0NHJ3_9GOBI
MKRAASFNYDPDDHRLRTLKKKRSRKKSKWSTGVIPKPKKKKSAAAPPAASSESCSSLSSLSESSENSDVPNAQLNGLTNGFHVRNTSSVPRLVRGKSVGRNWPIK